MEQDRRQNENKEVTWYFSDRNLRSVKWVIGSHVEEPIYHN